MNEGGPGYSRVRTVMNLGGTLPPAAVGLVLALGQVPKFILSGVSPLDFKHFTMPDVERVPQALSPLRQRGRVSDEDDKFEQIWCSAKGAGIDSVVNENGDLGRKLSGIEDDAGLQSGSVHVVHVARVYTCTTCKVLVVLVPGTLVPSR